VRWWRRAAEDAVRRRRISRRRADATGFAFPVCSYELPLVCYPGQEASFASKRANIARSLAACDGVVVGAGETFSFWRCAGRPTAARGYGSAAAMRDGVMGTEIGGAICFSATLLYNAGLLSGMEIAERWCHSVDTYGDARYFELGRDAAVEFAYRDLRMRNRAGVDLRIGARVELGRGVVGVWSAAPVDLD
jgi:vancomycin resistance protein VanW